ncbi:DUF6088 family protein [Sphingobium baderi]|uniref:DUF6088 family protein n=1 Tax=Sphingobium baderi TaxID=1332080 RepID=UPI001E5B0283|nr:DUF6088 family protein [Sphingobium baderi]
MSRVVFETKQTGARPACRASRYLTGQSCGWLPASSPHLALCPYSGTRSRYWYRFRISTSFLLGSRDALDQALHRLTRSGNIRRIARGLYGKPSQNNLAGKPKHPDPRSVVDALGRRDQARILIDRISVANDLGLSAAVPARIVVHSDAGLTPITLGNLQIEFKSTAPSRLYWAGRPAMRIVQTLHWLHEAGGDTDPGVAKRLRSIFVDPEHVARIVTDLRNGLLTLPLWMRNILRNTIPATSPTTASQRARAKHLSVLSR